MTLRKLLLTVLGFLLLPPGLCFAQVISQAQIMRFTYSNSPGTPPANSGYLYFNTSGVLTCINAAGGNGCSGAGGSSAFSALTSGTNTSAAMLVGTGASLAVTGSGTIAATSAPFSGITPGTNTGPLLVGSGGSLGPSGTGTIAATSVPSTGITGQIPIGVIGSAGLSGTSPLQIGATGAISCPTCNTSSAALASIFGNTGPTITALAQAGSNSLNGVVTGNASETVQQAMTATNGGVSEVPAISAATDNPAGTYISQGTTPASSFQIAGTVNFDWRYGQLSESYFNPTFNEFGNVGFAHSIVENLTATLASPPTTAFGLGVMQNIYDGGSNYGGNKANYEAFQAFENSWSQGQRTGIAAVSNCYGAGDCLALTGFVNCFAGSNAATDEGCELGDVSVSQGNVALVATVAAGGTAGSRSVTISPSAGSGTLGSGRFLLDTTTAASVTVTAISGTPPTYTFSGTPFTADTLTTDSTAVSAPGTQSITTVGTTTGITANSTLVCISDPGYYECFIPTAVAANSLTATFRKPHVTGARISWGPNAGEFIELNADRWTATGNIGGVNVLNTLRQAWPIVGCATTSTCIVWNDVASNYQPYDGQAKTSAATDAATVYSGAEVITVQAGGTWSNTLILAPNNVTFGTDAVEAPLYPGEKMTLQTTSINRFSPSPALAGSGAGMTYNGTFCCNDVFWKIVSTYAASNYAGHGGNLQDPVAFFEGSGVARWGLYFPSAPDVAAILIGLPYNSSGVQAAVNNWFSSFPLQAAGSAGNDELLFNSALDQFGLCDAGCGLTQYFPLIQGAAKNIAGAADFPVEAGWVSCTQANCASSATTLYTVPNVANVLMTVHASIACSASTSTATGLITISYTDISGTAQTLTSGTATCTTLGALSVAALDTSFTPEKNTAVQYSVTQANTPTGLQARVALHQESTN